MEEEDSEEWPELEGGPEDEWEEEEWEEEGEEDVRNSYKNI